MEPPFARAMRSVGTRWLVLGFVALAPAITPRLYASDEVQYFSYLRSVWFDHDVSFENEYQHFYDAGVARSEGFHETFLERQTETGKRITFATIGSALLWSPFYAVADLATRLARRLGAQVPADGYSQPYITAVAVGSAVYGWLSLVLALRLARSVAPALGATLAVWIGTPLLFYMYIAPPMSHACSAFAVALFVTIWWHVRRRWSARGTIALGAAAGLMVMVREQDLFIIVGPAVDALWQFRWQPSTERWRRLAALAAGAATALATFIPQAMAYHALNGYVGPSRLVTRKMTWWAPHGLEVLLSTEHGLLWWTPLVALSMVGLAAMVIRPDRLISCHTTPPPEDGTAGIRWLGVCALLMLASQVYVAGSVESWTVAGAFGQRRFVGLTIVFVIGLAATMRIVQHDVSRRVVAMAIALCVWWNIGLMAQFGTGTMDRQRLELARNARYTFLVLPMELPRLAYLYVFDRSFFYRTAR